MGIAISPKAQGLSSEVSASSPSLSIAFHISISPVGTRPWEATLARVLNASDASKNLKVKVRVKARVKAPKAGQEPQELQSSRAAEAHRKGPERFR